MFYSFDGSMFHECRDFPSLINMPDDTDVDDAVRNLGYYMADSGFGIAGTFIDELDFSSEGPLEILAYQGPSLLYSYFVWVTTPDDCAQGVFLKTWIELIALLAVLEPLLAQKRHEDVADRLERIILQLHDPDDSRRRLASRGAEIRAARMAARAAHLAAKK